MARKYSTPEDIKRVIEEGSIAQYLNSLALKHGANIQSDRASKLSDPVDIEDMPKCVLVNPVNEVVVFKVSRKEGFVDFETYKPLSCKEKEIGQWTTIAAASHALGVNTNLAWANAIRGLAPVWSPVKRAWVDLRFIDVWNDWLARTKNTEVKPVKRVPVPKALFRQKQQVSKKT